LARRFCLIKELAPNPGNVNIMHNIILSKVLGGGRVRTDIVEGTCVDYPIIGESFSMVSKSLTFGLDLRIVRTSTVKSIKEEDNMVIFETENSTYKLIVIE
jgi:hypothetical protein